MKTPSLLQKFFSPSLDPDLAANSDVQPLLKATRERILTTLYRIASLAGTILYVIVAIDAFDKRAYGVILFYGICVAACWLFAFHRSLPYQLRVFAIVFVLYAMGVFDLLFYGIGEDWRIHFYCFTIVTLLFMGRSASIWALFISSVTFLTIGALRSFGLWSINYSYIAFTPPPFGTILIFASTYSAFLGMIIAALSSLQREIEAAWIRQHATTLLLEKERALLEERVTQRTLELSQRNQELAESQQKAEAANQAKSRFLSHISHELRTPMNGVIGMTSLLLTMKLGQEEVEVVNTIRMSGDTMLTLINELLDLSKIEADKLVLEPVIFDLSLCIEESMELVETTANAKGIRISYVLEPTLPRYWVQDVTRLRQILVNLLANAVKFTEQGKVAILVRQVALDERRSELHFAVKDTGIGIPANKIDQLFQAFSQVDTSWSRRFGGTGLGLSISKRLCELMGGTIGVESEVGKGSTFYFSILAERTNELAHLPERKLLPLMNGSSQPVMPLRPVPTHLPRLLLAEDNLVNQKVILHILKQYGYQADVAANGLEVLAAMARQPYDIILMDISMPEMDGVEATRRLRAQNGTIQQPYIIAVTANALLQDRDEYLKSGMNDYVSKPVRADVLINALKRAQCTA